jgi:hypothetical protein
MAAGYPDAGDVIHPDSVGRRNMPPREVYTHTAGDVVQGPGKWDLDKADLRRMTTDRVLKEHASGEEISRAFGLGSSGAKILNFNKD